jgi:hypothetical protein
LEFEEWAKTSEANYLYLYLDLGAKARSRYFSCGMARTRFGAHARKYKNASLDGRKCQNCS